VPVGNLEVGEAAPDFALPAHTGETIKLSSFKDRSSVLIVFYPGDFTPICTRQLCSYTGAYEQFRKVGYEILGIGVDNIELHRKFAREKNISFPLLSDFNGEVCKAYGVWAPSPGARSGRCFSSTVPV
jgi:thioredoxin-dependent peroxiredoxin